VSEMHSTTSEPSKVPRLGIQVTHVAKLSATSSLTSHPSLPKVWVPHTPNGLELMEFSAQLMKESELLWKEQKQRQPRRWLVSVESPALLVAPPNWQWQSFVLSGAGVGAASPSSGTGLPPRRKVSTGAAANESPTGLKNL